MPRVVPDQKEKFGRDDLFRKLSRETEIRYTGFLDRPLQERQFNFESHCRQGRAELAFVCCGVNLQLLFESNAWSQRSEERLPTLEFVDFERERGKVHLKSQFILNGVCVVMHGWVDLRRLDGTARLEYDQTRAEAEDVYLRRQLDDYGRRLRQFERQHQLLQADRPEPRPAHSALLGQSEPKDASRHAHSPFVLQPRPRDHAHLSILSQSEAQDVTRSALTQRRQPQKRLPAALAPSSALAPPLSLVVAPPLQFDRQACGSAPRGGEAWRPEARGGRGGTTGAGEVKVVGERFERGGAGELLVGGGAGAEERRALHGARRRRHDPPLGRHLLLGVAGPSLGGQRTPGPPVAAQGEPGDPEDPPTARPESAAECEDVEVDVT